MGEIEIGGNAYQIGRIDAMRQLHVSRRVVPVLIAAGISIADVVKSGAGTEGDAWLMRVADKALDVVAKMSNEDVEYVVQTSLSVAKRRPVGGDGPWALVMNGKQFQFQDMDMRTMVQVTLAVLRENMGGFFPQAPDARRTPTGS